MEVAIANPVKKGKVRRTKSLKKKSRRKRKNAWFGEGARHSKARSTGHAGPTYKGKRRKKKNPLGIVSNPKGGPMKRKKGSRKRSTKIRRHKSRSRTVRVRHYRNPANANDAMKFLGGAVIGGLATRVVASKVAPMVEGMLGPSMAKFAKPGIAAGVTAALYFAGGKVIKDDKLLLGMIGGSGFVAAESAIKALAPDMATSFLSDIGAIEMSNDLAGILVSDDDDSAAALLSDYAYPGQVDPNGGLTVSDDDDSNDEDSTDWSSNFN